jgi:hypothetical protein
MNNRVGAFIREASLSFREKQEQQVKADPSAGSSRPAFDDAIPF